MDIQEEREAFEASFRKKHNLSNSTKSFELSGGEYYFPLTQASWEGWQAAKAYTVPEGFVVVSKDRLTKAVDGIEALFEEDCTLALGQLLPIQQDLNAMIEAQVKSLKEVS